MTTQSIEKRAAESKEIQVLKLVRYVHLGYFLSGVQTSKCDV